MLVSFDDLKNLYGMPNLRAESKTQFENLLATAEEEVIAYAEISEGEFEETLSGATVYILAYRPLLEIESVTGTSTYTVNNRLSMITVNSTDAITVRYKAGYETMPRIIKQCIAITVQYWAKYINSNLVGVSSRSVDGGSENIEQYELPMVVKSALDRFRRSVY